MAANTAPTFVTGGVISQVDSFRGYSPHVLVNADGTFYLVGPTNISKFKADGGPDTSYSADGYDQIFDLNVDLQADGTFVAINSYGNMNRIMPDGTLDPFWKADLDLSSLSHTSQTMPSISAQPGGKIVAYGTISTAAGSTSAYISRFKSDGTTDISFGTNGLVSFGLNQYSSPKKISTLPDGKIIIFTSYELIRLNSDGSFDLTFSQNGVLELSEYSSNFTVDFLVQPDGKIVTFSNIMGLVSRYNIDGSVDTSFGQAGSIKVDGDPYFRIGSGSTVGGSLEIGTDGSLYVAAPQIAGFDANGSSLWGFWVAKLSSSGTLDSTYGVSGVARHLPSENGFYMLSDIELLNDGSLIAAGTAFPYGYGHFIAFKLDPHGMPQNAFGPSADSLSTTSAQWLYEDGNTILLDNMVRVADAELQAAGSFAGSSISLMRHGGAQAVDTFSAFANGNMSNLVEGTYLSVDGVTVGRVTTNSNGVLKITFGANSNALVVEHVLSQIAYTANLGDTPPSSVQLDWTFSDGNVAMQGTGGALSVTKTMTINIIAQNDRPYTNVGSIADHATIGQPYQYLLPAAAFVDPDTAYLQYRLKMVDGSGVPPWLSIDSATGHVTGTPAAEDQGSFALFIEASDGQSVASIQFTLDVRPVNVLTGDDNSNIVVGTDGVDNMRGLAGDDRLTGFEDNDTLTGGDGNDTLQGGAGGDLLDGGTGNDTADYADSLSAVAVDLGIKVAQDTKGAGKDTLTSIENLTGSNFADALTGNGLANVLAGCDGIDVLKGNAGSDTLDGGAGADRMFGGAGNDTYYVDGTGDRVYETATPSGTDTTDLGGTDTVSSSIGYTLGKFIENLTLTGTGSYSGTGNELANTLRGNDGANTLKGLAGNDILRGNAGGDKLDGGLGADNMFGGAGNDTYYVENAGDRVYETASVATADNTDLGGKDTVSSSIGFTLGKFLENLTLTGTGNYGGSGNELANTLVGNDGANTLRGLGGNDILKGGTGNDKLFGGAGKDALTGGAGKDTFVFDTAPTSRDTITDFSRTDGDKIQLSRAVFAGFAYTGTLHAEDFYAAAGATKAYDATDRLIYNTTTGVLYYDADGLGGTAAVQVALLGASTHPALVYGDLQIIA